MTKLHARCAILGACLIATGLIAGCDSASDADVSFRADLPNVTRTWIGPAFWSNPLQDWRIHNGRIESLTTDYDRSVSLLTYELADGGGDFRVRTRLGLIERNAHNLDPGWVGFRVGGKGEFNDYRDSAVNGIGLNAGMSTTGQLFIGEPRYGREGGMTDELHGALMEDGVVLDLEGVSRGEGQYELRLRLENATGDPLDSVSTSVAGDTLTGLFSLVADYDKPPHDPYEERTYHSSFWFSDWEISGGKVRSHPERAFGPILFALHTLSDGTLNMTAQLSPVSNDDGRKVALALQHDGDWRVIETSAIDTLSRTASFRVRDWPDSIDVPYRLIYESVGSDGQMYEAYWNGTVRKDPAGEEDIVVAGFTGNNDIGFPHADLVERVKAHDPDILIFTGDQIYETVGGYGYIHSPVDKAMLDYLRKWYLFGWEFGELLRDIPAVTILDDHDVFQGNIWGEAGKAANLEGIRKDMQDSGGYLEPAEWVNAVQRTQTAHLPEPYDPTPVLQDIEVYYTDLTHGGISFAIIEDRKWKSAPKSVLPAYLKIENGWTHDERGNPPEALDSRDAVLLGQRQLDFLDDWAADWSEGTWMKMLVSQTIFNNVATLPDTAWDDSVVPHLEILPRGEYAPNDRIVQDMDSNAWPKRGRDEALRRIRKGFAFHLAGDQHLGSTIQYGVDEWGDAGYALCVPSVSNFYPRRWYPPTEGKNRPEGAPKNIGDYLDGFGNHMTVLAVSNPYETGAQPSALYDRAPGYGIVKLNRQTRDIEIANWPRHIDSQNGDPYPGWPITINQMDNYGRQAAAWLPTIEVNGQQDAVVQIVDEESEEIVYTVRINGRRFEPKVFKRGTYTIRVGEPDRGMEEIKGVESHAERDASTLTVEV